MGGEEKKPEEGKKPEKAAGDDKKKEEGEKKADGGGEGKESGKDGKEEAPAPAPPPPEIVLRVYMQCEGCARKVKKSLRGFNGVEDVITDCKNHTVVVKGEKADPMKVLERVQRKSHRRVELLSPIPKPPTEEELAKKAAEEKEPPKEEKKEEQPKVITVVLKVHMHCEACAEEIKKRIEKMKEVEVATPDQKNSEVTVKGTFDPPNLVDYVYRRTGKHAVIVKQEPEEAKEGKEEKKGDKEEEKKGDGEAKEEKKEGGEAGEGGGEEEMMKLVEMRRNELYYYPPKYGVPMYHTYPPQIFSDENPNACSVM